MTIRIRRFSRRLAAALIVIAVLSTDRLPAQRLSIPKAQIVLFTPSDVKPPPAGQYRVRLDQFGRFAERFFHDGLKDWGYIPKRKEIFERDADGKLSVIHVVGDLPAAGDAYRQKWISDQVYKKLRSDYNLKPAGHLFWIFVYIGDPPAEHSNYRGSGNSKDGGWAILNYTNIPGNIALKGDVVSSFHDKLFLKGCIHEFGHALGLPHIGPKAELRKGNTLMGPITRIYVQNKMPNKTKAYLSEASAAILSVHPIFTGDPTARNKLPKTQFKQVSISYDKSSHAMVVSGQLETNHDVHRIIVIDDRDDKIGGYWVKAYVAHADDQSRFRLSITAPNRTGTLKILAIYKNGAFTGDGKKRGIESATTMPYLFR